MSGGDSNDQIEALLRGDSVIINKLYKRLLPKVILYVEANSGTAEDAEEVFQETIFRVLKRARERELRINTTLTSYVYVACRNHWINEAKKRSRLSRNESVDELKEQESNDLETHQAQWSLIEEKLELLSGNCRDLLKDHLNKMSYDDMISKYQYATKNTAFQRIFKCKKRLLELVRADERYQDL